LSSPPPDDDDRDERAVEVSPESGGREARKSRSTKPKRSFEQAIGEIERIVADLEGGKLELAQSLEKYQTGIGTLKECYTILEGAERQISLLAGFDADGNAITEPFEESLMSVQDKQSARSSRRSSPKRSSPKPDNDRDGDVDTAGEGFRGGLF